MEDKLLKDLNNEQKQAVTYNDGPLLVIAGAGTGKTKTITHKAAYLISQKIAKSSEILALTFTDKAAKEMEERIDLLVPLGTYDFTATTFHSFCQDILKEYGIIGGISPDFKLLTQSQQILFLRQNLDQFNLNIYKPISNPQKFLASLIKLFSRAKDEMVTVGDYQKLAKKYQDLSKKNPDDLELAEKALLISEQADAYKIYEELKTKENYFDFGDLIIKTLNLISTRKTVLKNLQERYRYIFVDEFQDTNYAQVKLVYMLANKYQNLTVVGDDDQSIYKFRGASISNIMEFLQNYPKAKKIVLNHNYRSTKEILNSSYNLIKNNNPNRLEFQEQINKKLSSSAFGANPEFWQFKHNSSEIEEIIKDIIKKVSSKKLKFNDFAILVRANAYADDFINILKNLNIPYHFTGSRGLYDREEIREIISYLKTLHNPDNNLALFHVANADQFKLDKIILRRLVNLSKEHNIPLVEIFSDIKNFLPKNNFNISPISKIVKLINDHLKYARTWNTSRIIIDYMYQSEMYAQIKRQENFETMEKLENIRIFFNKISEFENISRDKTVFEFIEYLNLIIDAGDNPPVFEEDKYENAVNVMTIHAAKGLEFDTVYLPYLVHGRFPSNKKTDPIELPEELIKETIPKGDIHLEEERRLCYVALTRAKKRLILSASKNYLGNIKEKRTSQFAMETIDKKFWKNFDQSSLNELEKPKNKISKFKRKQINLSLSPSAIETFDSCPKRYEYSYIFRMRPLPSQSMSFGDSIHNTLRDCHNILIARRKITQSEIETSFKFNWKDAGYLSKKEEASAYKLGLISIIKFLNNNKIIPSEIEKKISWPIDKSVKVSGRIDRIDSMGNSVNIIDFKTGDGRKKTKSELSKNLPLWLYAMYFHDIKKIENINITLHYILSDKIISMTANKEKINEKKSKIAQIAKNILEASTNYEFIAKPTEFECRYCSYKSICPNKFKGA